MIGRKREFQILRECAEADRSRLVVVYGRRRVGKTFLAREAFDYSFTFTHAGIEKGSYRGELFAFWYASPCRLRWALPRHRRIGHPHPLSSSTEV